MRSVFIAATLFAVTITTTAQREPTLAETAAWLESDARPLLVLPDNPVKQSELHLRDCVLSWTITIQRPSHVTVPLKDLDPRAIVVARDSGMWAVGLHARHETGQPIQYTRGTGRKTAADISLYVRNADDRQRVANALQRAAVLCGAPVSAF